MPLERILAAVRTEISSGEIRVAKARLLGLLSTYPTNLEVRRELQHVYRRLGDPVQAGRWGFLVDADAEPDEAEAFVKWSRRGLGGRQVVHPHTTICRLLRWPGPITPTNPHATQLLALAEDEEARERRRAVAALAGCGIVALVILAVVILGLVTLIRAIG